MKAGRTLSELAQEIETQQSRKRDMVADTRAMELFAAPDGRIALQVEGDRSTILATATPTLHALRQIGSRLHIPAAYVDRMQKDAPELLATNVNHWFQVEPERRMVRMMGDGRGAYTARAFLSDRYQRIDHADVAGAVLPILAELGREAALEVQSCEITETRLYIKAVSPRVSGEVKRGDVVQAGVLITNSEIGAGAMTVSPLVYRLACLNGLVLPDAKFRKHHVGGRVETGDSLAAFMSDETLAADDRAILLKTRDTVRAALNGALFGKALEAMRAAADPATKIEGDPAKVVELVAARVNLNEGERGGVLRHLIEGGDLSRWGVVNAVTRFAQDVASYDRSTELEAAGGVLLALPAPDWSKMAKAA